VIYPPIAAISDGEWGFFSACIVAGGGAFAGMIRIILGQRDDINELTEKMMDKAVAQALKDQDPGPRRRGP
jgi:hypothetical protein